MNTFWITPAIALCCALSGCASLQDAMLSDETKACRAKGSQMVPTKYTSMMNFYGEMVYSQEYECLP
jgi:hypothetical protein